MKPSEVTILGVTYKIEYVEKPSDVDIFRREALWGQIDYWTRTIRIYDNGRQLEDVWQTIIHEVLHGIAEGFKLELKEKDRHEELDLLAAAITDTLFRNNGLKVDSA